MTNVKKDAGTDGGTPMKFDTPVRARLGANQLDGRSPGAPDLSWPVAGEVYKEGPTVDVGKRGEGPGNSWGSS